MNPYAVLLLRRCRRRVLGSAWRRIDSSAGRSVRCRQVRRRRSYRRLAVLPHASRRDWSRFRSRPCRFRRLLLNALLRSTLHLLLLLLGCGVPVQTQRSALHLFVLALLGAGGRSDGRSLLLR